MTHTSKLAIPNHNSSHLRWKIHKISHNNPTSNDTHWLITFVTNNCSHIELKNPCRCLFDFIFLLKWRNCIWWMLGFFCLIIYFYNTIACLLRHYGSTGYDFYYQKNVILKFWNNFWYSLSFYCIFEQNLPKFGAWI